MPSQRIFISTGDFSGNHHAASVAQALRALNPAITLHGVGGQAMAQAGVELLADQSATGTVGLYGLGTIWRHWRLGRQILDHLKTFQPETVLLVDYGGFHLQLAKRLKQQGYRVLYYIPPQVWASRPGRLKTIKRNVDHVFCIFPFEQALYEAQDIPVTYVGHPLVGQLPPPVELRAFCSQHGLDPNRPLVGLFPGSRKMEIASLLPVLLQAVPLIIQTAIAHGLPVPQFCLAQASSLDPAWFESQWQRHAPWLKGQTVQRLIGQNHALLSASTAVVLASGTVTLEAALYGTPMVVAYKGPGWMYPVFKALCRLPSIALPNVLFDGVVAPTGARIVPELWQNDATPQGIATALQPLLVADSPIRQTQKTALSQVCGALNAAALPAAKQVAALMTTL
jgi:lipid-A-disaccharide synthase